MYSVNRLAVTFVCDSFEDVSPRGGDDSWQEVSMLVLTRKREEAIRIVAHGNSLRALVKHLDGVSDADIVELNIPTGIPLVYELDEDLKPIRHYYLGDTQSAQKAMQAVASQASRKD